MAWLHKSCSCTFKASEIHKSVLSASIQWWHCSRYWPFVWGIHRSPWNSPHKGQWRGALMLYLICAWINVWINYRETGDLRRHRAHYDVTVMTLPVLSHKWHFRTTLTFKKESRLRLRNTKVNKSYFRAKLFERKIKRKTRVMYDKWIEARNQ